MQAGGTAHRDRPLSWIEQGAACARHPSDPARSATDAQSGPRPSPPQNAAGRAADRRAGAEPGRRAGPNGTCRDPGPVATGDAAVPDPGRLKRKKLAAPLSPRKRPLHAEQSWRRSERRRSGNHLVADLNPANPNAIVVANALTTPIASRL